MYVCNYVCIFILEYLCVLEFVFPPSTVILFPGETSAIFECVINPSAIIISWEVNTARYGLDELFKGHLPGHNVSGTNITVSVPMNGTKYVCVIPAVPPNPTISSNPAFLYIASKLYFAYIYRRMYLYSTYMYIYTR